MPLNLRAFSPNNPVTVYRVEVKDQDYQYDPVIRPKWSHVHNTNNALDAYVYQPKPMEEFRKKFRPQVQRRKDIMRKDALKKRKGYAQGRNDVFLNFGNLYRALEFYYQKSTNELDKDFVIRTFQIPNDVWLELMGKAVHEDVAKDYPGRPYNVDRKTYNQLGLREKHVHLINQNIIPATSQEKNPDVMINSRSLSQEERTVILHARNEFNLLREFGRLSNINI